jgi:hypothetical protein
MSSLRPADIAAMLGAVIVGTICALFIWLFLKGTIAKRTMRITILIILIVSITVFICAWMFMALRAYPIN